VVRAQIPGRITRVWVAAGDHVEAGQRLLAIEAMKMENEVRTPRAGIVESVAATVGSAVELGDELVIVS
jgi:biotin carboxyl carrier protein